MITLVLIIEVIVVLLVVVGFLFFWQWKAKKNKTAEVEELLENIRNKEAERKTTLTQHLEKSYALDNTAANEIGGYMVEAEKQFLHQFLKQQVKQTSLTGFYEALCELLDQYLYFIPSAILEKDGASQDQAVEKNDLAPEVIQPQVNTQEKDVPNVTAEESKNIGSDTDEKSEKQEKIALAENTEPDSAEPDWGAAFAESGDKIDESTKAEYDQEGKKD